MKKGGFAVGALAMAIAACTSFGASLPDAPPEVDAGTDAPPTPDVAVPEGAAPGTFCATSTAELCNDFESDLMVGFTHQLSQDVTTPRIGIGDAGPPHGKVLSAATEATQRQSLARRFKDMLGVPEVRVPPPAQGMLF